MDSWREYFHITACSNFVVPGLGEFNSENNEMPVEKLKKAYEKGCPFIVPTQIGMQKFYPDVNPITVKDIEINNTLLREPQQPKMKKKNNP